MTTPMRSQLVSVIIRTAGIVLLLAWLAIWICSFIRGQSCLRGWSWLPLWDRLSVDVMGNFLCSRAWVAGANPYQVEFSPLVPVTCALLPIFALFVVTTQLRLIEAATPTPPLFESPP